jgi:cytochrome c biogenesis protein CcmG/thiol:disulfide interchange protein DsbE
MEEKNQQNSRYKSVTLFFVISFSLGCFILLQGKDSFINLSDQVRLKPGLLAPNFTFPGLDGKMVSLTDYKGKVVFLNIWATWCGPCREEMPSMERLYKILKSEDFIILAVSIDASGAKAVAPFVRDYKLNFPILLDPKGTIQILYGTTGVPESFIIDKEGVLAQITIGPREWDSPDAIQFFRNLIQKP